jgi:hypothetical protein
MSLRGSKPGERRGGRKIGTPNKTTVEIRLLAQKHVPDAIKEAARLMLRARSEQARLAAISLILDRAFGRPSQSHEFGGVEGQTIIVEISERDAAV